MVNRAYCIHFCVGFEEGKSFKISQLQRFDQIGFTCRSVARCPFVQLDFRFSRHFSESIDSWSFIGFVLKFETCHIWNYLMMFYSVFFIQHHVWSAKSNLNCWRRFSPISKRNIKRHKIALKNWKFQNFQNEKND